MKTLVVAAALAWAFVGQAFAWGPEGHSIVAEIAQERLANPAAEKINKLLHGRSLASIASWADDVRDERPNTYNWHFVDIPLDVKTYDPKRDCKANAEKGDCIIAELERLRKDLPCASGERQIEDLKFAVHFMGDLHQPLHTVLEKKGGNDIPVDVYMRGLATCANCTASHTKTNFHHAWDVDLIQHTVWAWGSYIDRLDDGWLKTSEAKAEDPATDHVKIDENTFIKWAEATHAAARTVWYARPADDVLGDQYLKDVLPILDRQLGLAGLRLARFLNQAFASSACPVN
jgi:nuclease S1